MKRTSCGANCSCCEKHISFFTIDKSVWAYRVKKMDNRVDYQCSYPCWRKEKKRDYDERKRFFDENRRNQSNKL